MPYKCIKVRNMGKYLFKTGCKWKNKVKGAYASFEVTRNGNMGLENWLREVKRELLQ
jgi:hypothetical protein